MDTENQNQEVAAFQADSSRDRLSSRDRSEEMERMDGMDNNNQTTEPLDGQSQKQSDMNGIVVLNIVGN